jgi:hypothetical protein
MDRRQYNYFCQRKTKAQFIFTSPIVHRSIGQTHRGGPNNPGTRSSGYRIPQKEMRSWACFGFSVVCPWPHLRPRQAEAEPNVLPTLSSASCPLQQRVSSQMYYRLWGWRPGADKSQNAVPSEKCKTHAWMRLCCKRQPTFTSLLFAPCRPKSFSLGESNDAT